MAVTLPAQPEPTLSGGLARTVAGLAATVSVLIAVCPPAAYFSIRYTAEALVAQREARMIAASVTGVIARQPESWRFKVLTLGEMLAPQGLVPNTAEHRLLRAADGSMLVEALQPEGLAVLPRPTLARSAPAFDHGLPAAEVVVQRSLRPTAERTALVGLASVLLALAAFAALRVLPLRMLRRALDRAAWLATHDPLTGLPNRALFRERLASALATARRDGTAVAVLYLDLDHFKEVNDTLGHGAGDRLLRELASRLSMYLRETDTLARLGGDEFAIVQTHARQPADAERLAMRLLGIIARPIDLDGNQMVIGTSIGIAVTEAGASDPTRLLQEADLALYQAKAEGRSGYRFFEAAMNERLQARRALEADLRQALAGGQFRMLYQPQVELGEDGDTPRVVGAEALIRWDHPTRGELSPDRFMPLTEENGLILPIGEWVLNEACAEAMTWPAPLRVAVNVSPMQFAHSGFVAAVERALAATGLPAERLELEVTEGILLSETDETVATLTRLRAMGVKLAMDDFGTGYSSLGYLRKFRFDKIKIDRSFVSHIGSDAEAAAIVRAIVRITHALGMRANAEGVETEEQVGMLRAEGCGEVQGFLFGRPMSAKSFAALIAEPSQPSLQRQAA